MEPIHQRTSEIFNARMLIRNDVGIINLVVG